jgi:hypothetical protein
MPQFRGLKDAKKLSFKVGDDYLSTNRLRCVTAVPQNCRLDVVSKGTGGGKAIKKEKLSKQEKMKMSSDQIKGMAQTLLKYASHNSIVKDFRTKLNDSLKKISSDTTFIKTILTNATAPQKVVVAKALQSGNTEHKVDAISKVIFETELATVLKNKKEMDECLETMRAVASYAITKEFSNDHGAIQWNILTEILVGENPDDIDGLKDIYKQTTILVCGNTSSCLWKQPLLFVETTPLVFGNNPSCFAPISVKQWSNNCQCL